jgi:hypothetical protein
MNTLAAATHHGALHSQRVRVVVGGGGGGGGGDTRIVATAAALQVL